MRKRIAIPITVLGAALIGLLLVELGLRVLGVSHPSFYQADAERGAALRPGAEGLYVAEGGAHIQINEHGMRDRPRTLKKPPGTYRVALLGDSYVEALQVKLDQTLGAVLERRLAECSGMEGRQVEVLNFGVSGYGTTQELLTYRHRAREFDPDLVLLAFLPGNDLRDNSWTLSPSRVRPFHRIDGEALVLDRSFLETNEYTRRTSAGWRLATFFVDHFKIAQLLNHAKNRRTARREAAQMDAVAASTGLEEFGLDGFVFRDPVTPDEREAWEVSERVLLELKRDTAGDGVRLLVAVLSSGVQVHPDPAVRRQAREELGVQDLFYPGRRLSAFGEGNGIEVLALAPELARLATDVGEPLHGFDAAPGFGHWNEAGHRAAATLLAGTICRGLRQPASSPTLSRLR